MFSAKVLNLIAKAEFASNLNDSAKLNVEEAVDILIKLSNEKFVANAKPELVELEKKKQD